MRGSHLAESDSPHESSSSLSPDKGVLVREEGDQWLEAVREVTHHLLPQVGCGEVVEQCGCPAADEGGGVCEEWGGGGDGTTLQALGWVHLETPVEGRQQQLLGEGGGGEWVSE